MILVLLGTQNNNFYRLLEEIDKNIENKKITEEVVVQAGFTKYESKNMKIFDEIEKDKWEKFIEEASFIITHGGVGSITTSIKKGKKVIAVPRLKKYNEHVNNHQLDIINEFNKKGYIIGINSIEELKDALDKIENFIPRRYEGSAENIINLIEEFINK